MSLCDIFFLCIECARAGGDGHRRVRDVRGNSCRGGIFAEDDATSTWDQVLSSHVSCGSVSASLRVAWFEQHTGRF